ncbi:reverse transcriptase domain-containing protein [Tanacetum coccineum]
MSQPANDEFSQHLSDDEASNHEDASDTGAAPKQKQQVIPQTTAISNIKLPILKKEEYDIWAMEMEHYLEYIDNDVWKVIQNGNSKKRISTGKDGVIRILPPVTAAEIQAVEKERKAKNILLMAIPKEHMRRFHGMDDAKEIWEAIRTRFGGNANSKKMQKAVFKQQFEAFTISSSEGLEKGYDRFQQLLSQLEAHGAEVSTEDANYKFLRSLPPAWSNLAMTMRTKPDVDTLSIDDFKSNTNKVKSGFTGAYSTCTPSTSSTNIPEKEVLAGFADEVIYSLFAKQSEDWDLLHEDLEQIDNLDIEEMDINWQIAMIDIRMKKFYKKIGRRVRVDGKTLLVLTKKSLNASIVTTLVILLGNVQQRGHMMERRGETHFINTKKLVSKRRIRWIADNDMYVNGENILKIMSSNSKVGLGYEIQSNNEVLSYEEEMNFSVFKGTEEDSVGKPLYSRFIKANNFKGVPHPLSGDYTPKPQEEIDESFYVYGSIGTSSEHSLDPNPDFKIPLEVTMADNRTMAQLLEAPTEGYEDAIVVPEITADNFELKHGLLTLVQNKQFFGHDKEDPHAHIRYFNKITSTMKFPNVPSTSVKLMLFPFSLEGAARIWLEKEPPRSILTWDDLVSKFINKFFPPSKTTNLRNEITRFQQRFDETFYEAWDRFNDLLRACPHHGFSELHQLDTFYNALNSNDQDSLNSAAGGNFLDKMPRDCLRIIESKSKVRNSRNKPVVAKVSTSNSTPGISPDVAELKDMVKALLLDKKNQSQAPAPVKAVEESCVICGGAHSYRNCPATDGNVYRDNI